MSFKMTWKIWLLSIVLVLSIISIFNSPSQYPLLLLAFFAIFVTSFFIDSKAARIISVLLLGVGIFLLAYSSLSPEGVLVSSVEVNSTAFEQGLRQGQIITAIDGKEVINLASYSQTIQSKFPSEEKVRTLITTSESEFVFFSDAPPKITVTNIPSTNLQMGLDLVGGSRALVKAKDLDLNSDETSDLAAVLSNRLNVYGISDVTVKPISDLSGNNFVLIEIAGATPKDIENLVSKQGKFEAKIGNQTVFVGGEKDIASIGRNAQESRIEGCYESSGGYYCRFSFTVYLSEDSANRHAKITDALSINKSNPQYLNESLDLYLDDKIVDSLLISEGLKGRVETKISISGSGSGASRDDALKNAEEEMKRLQTILITGSLPYQLEIVKLDTISPTLGKEFVQTILIAALAAFSVVALIIFGRYRKVKSSLALLLTSASEVIIILGVAALIKWNIDLPSIAGILATIGTGIDQQIIVLDEARSGQELSIIQKLKRAFSIILGAYFTVLVSLLPLLWAGAGLLKGFAITTIIGISVGVLITRPAFTDFVRNIED